MTTVGAWWGALATVVLWVGLVAAMAGRDPDDVGRDGDDDG